MPLFALCLGFFIVIIDVMIVNVALPTMALSLSTNLSGLQWVVDGYTLTFASLLLSAGNIGDKLGAKTAFIVGLALFVLTSLICGFAPSLSILVIARFFQGVAAAFIVPTSVALINASYSDKHQRAKAIGIWATIGGVAGASGPIIGAFLTAWFGWRSVFFVNVPIGIAAIYLTVKYVANTTGNKQAGFDIAGQLTAIIWTAALAFMLIEAGRMGWFSLPVISAAVIFGACLLAFILAEHYSKAPMLPLTFFKSKTFSVAMLVGMILNLGFYGILFLMPLYFLQVRGYSVLQTGLAVIPLVILSAVSSYLSGKIVSAYGPKVPMVIGLLIMTIASLGLLITRQHGPDYTALILPLLALGFGATFTMPAATLATLHSVPEGRAGIASGAFNASRQLGSLIGVAVFGTIINFSSSFVSGMHVALIINSILLLSMATLAYIFV